MLVERELLNYEIEVVHEGVMHVLFDIAIQIGRYVEGLIRPLYLLDPDVEHAQLLVDEALEAVGLLQHVVDAAHQEREKAQADELDSNKTTN